MASEFVVLLVEDEPMIREIIEAVLEGGGYGVVQADNGTDALAAFEAEPARFCAVITDIQLESAPNGWRLAEDLRDIRGDLPVLYMSGGSAHEWATRGASASLMLAKPFSPLDLLTALSRLLALDGIGESGGQARTGAVAV